MSRAKGWTGVWRVAVLLAGALTQLSAGQALAQRPGITSAPLGSSGGYDVRPEQKRLAVSKLVQARALLAQGDIDEAERLATEAARLNVSWISADDSPTRLLSDTQRARTDPKMLLLASRSALNRQDYLRAERYARLADRHSSMLSFTPWGDSPKKVLQDIESAQKNPVVKTTTPSPSAPTTTTTARAPWSKKPVEPQTPPVVQTNFNAPSTPTTTPPSNAVASNPSAPPAHATMPPATPKPGDETDEARQVLQQARQALARKDFERANALVAVAKQMKHNLGWWDDNPDKVENDIRRAEGRPSMQLTKDGPAKQTVKPQPAPTAAKPVTSSPTTTKTATVSATPGIPNNKQEARALLALGRQQFTEGKLDEAAQTAQRIKAQKHLSWGLFEDSPDRLSIDVEKAREARDREESVRLLAEGRKLYEQGDYEGATRLAYRAQKLHGSYSIWDLGDRPTKLLSDVQAAQARSRKVALPPAQVAKNTPATAPTTSKAPTTPEVSSNSLPPAPGSTIAVNAPPVVSTKPTDGPKLPESPERLKAQQLVAEAQRLHLEDKLIEARQKALEAQQLNVRFGPDETSPEFVYQQVTVQARQKIESLIRTAQNAVAQAQHEAAAAKLQEARTLATSFGLDSRPIEVMLVSVGGMTQPTASTEVVKEGASMPTVSVAVPSASPQGQKLLEDARAELRKGETGNARRLVESALTGDYNVNDDAMALLRTIDAEELNQKQRETNRTFDAALAAFRRREYERASAMIATLDLKLLDADRQGRLREISLTPEMTAVAKASSKSTSGRTHGEIRTVSDVSPLPTDELNAHPLPPTVPGLETGRAVVSDSADGGLLDKHRQMQKVLFEKLRQDSLEVQREAAEKFRTGQTDAALETLQDYVARLQEEQLEPGQLSLLRRPIESRMSQFRLLKAQKDLAEGAVASRQASTEKIQAKFKAEEMKQKNVEKLMKDFNTYFKEGKYLEAESLAMRALELDPDNGVASAAVYMARRQRDVTAYEKIKHGRERLVLEGLNDAEKQPGYRAIEAGVDYDEDRWNQAKKRKAIEPMQIGKRSEKEKLIERQLTAPITVSFDNQPLRVVLDELRQYNDINIVPDLPALQEAGVSIESPISIKLEKVSLKSALNLILHQVRLTHVIRDEVLIITTEENAKGKTETVSYSVADLVIPVENFGDIRNGYQPVVNPTNVQAPPSAQGPMPFTGPFSMVHGQPTGTPAGGSMLDGTGGISTSMSSGGPSTSKRSPSNTTEEQLIKLITSTIQPRSWSEMGGPGTIEYHPMTMALIINQTPDIQEQIQELLASLRRLQDQEVSVEVRFISVSEDFFERVGVNFNMNVLTNNKRHEPAIQTGAFVPDSSQFINAFRPGRFLAGMTPAGTLTPTLDIPITQNSFFQTVPQFGNYTAGGLTMGLAFLSDIQVFLFLEAAQGDVRANVMQAPKLTLFNGQTATLNVFDQQSFVSGVQIAQVQGTGQFAIVPQNNPQFNGIFLTIQAVISADRRFVRLTMAPQMTNLLPGPIFTFPVVVPIFTSVEGTQVGQPVLLTQLLQQPVQTNIQIQTTVAVPDGGTVLMGGLKKLSEARSEYGPPILSKVPYINRLFKNVGYGRETDSMLIMVTPRIIVQAEEEERQTGFSSASVGGSVGL